VAFAGVPEDEARKILGENALRAFPVGGEHLHAVADRIGPDPSILLSGGDAVPNEQVEHYHGRGGFLRAVERVDQDAIIQFADEDLQWTH
jgi:hypothetical protein